MTIRILIGAPARASTAFGREAGSPPAAGPAGMPSVVQGLSDCGGGPAHRKDPAGDRGGAGSALAHRGILFDADVTQLLQGAAHEGRNTSSAFGRPGSADDGFKPEAARMGLRPGGLLAFDGEMNIGDSVNPKAGSLTAPDGHGLLPVPGDPETITPSQPCVVPAPAERLVLAGGRIDGTVRAERKAFTPIHRNRFIHVGPRIRRILRCAAPCTCAVGGGPRPPDAGPAFCFLKVFETSWTAQEDS